MWGWGSRGFRSGSVIFEEIDITNAPLSASPKLNLAYNGDVLWLWWPLGYGGFNVQSTTNLTPPVTWSPVTPAEINRHSFHAAEPMKFFRMIQP